MEIEIERFYVLKQELKDYLFASDLDDTMLDSKKEISAENRRAVAAFLDQGGRFVIATGRAVPATEPYVTALHLPYPCVLYNGAAIYDFNQHRFLWTAALPPEARGYLKEVMDRFPGVGAEILKDENIFVLRKNIHISRHVDIEKLDYTETEADAVSDGWFKILFVMEERLLDQVWEFIISRQYEGVDFVKSSVNYIEMLPQGISKGSTVIRLAKMLGIQPEHTMAIGDYNNDIEMLEQTAYSFAVRNAPEQVKQVADQIAPDCDHDAVAYALHSFYDRMGIKI